MLYAPRLRDLSTRLGRERTIEPGQTRGPTKAELRLCPADDSGRSGVAHAAPSAAALGLRQRCGRASRQNVSTPAQRAGVPERKIVAAISRLARLSPGAVP